MYITEKVINNALANTLHAPEMVVVEMRDNDAIIHNTASGRSYVCPFGCDEFGPFILVKNEIVRLHTLNIASHC